MKRFAVAALAIAASARPALAADEFVYIVNATGAQDQFVIDGRVFPPLDHLMALSARTSPGRRMIAAGVPQPIVDGKVTSTGVSISPHLTLETGIVDAQKRTFWCFMVRKETDGALRIVSAAQPICTELVRRGVGDRVLN